MKILRVTTAVSSIFILISLSSLSIVAQDINFPYANTITTATSFLLFDEDARIAGFGSIGSVAGTDYMDAGTWSNPALISRRKNSIGGSFTYYLWLRDLLDNTQYSNGNFLYSFNKSNVASLHVKYFDLGKMVSTDLSGQITDIFNPYEYAVKLSYAHHFKKGFSVGASTSYFVSNLAGNRVINGINVYPAKSYAFGMGWNYDNSIGISESIDLLWGLGGSITNLGPKIAYSDSAKWKDFIPANLSMGLILSPTFHLPCGYKLSIDLAYEAEKLLVPSPPHIAYDPLTGEHTIVAGMDPDVPVLQSYIQSFYDAPGGKEEELHEIVHQFGAELRLNGQDQLVFAIRQGYFNEDKTKGNRKYHTTGFSVGYRGFMLNYSNYYGIKNSIDRHDWFLQLAYLYEFN
ncbi:MAG: PorV/PorQ family protein [Bacteroidales bacterium]|nr:PorV/PorQ family protein [Bacteroidales bacterium]MCF8458135.1 PorV/PorQ family protein [Bacteroidales bacterium]